MFFISARDKKNCKCCSSQVIFIKAAKRSVLSPLYPLDRALYVACPSCLFASVSSAHLFSFVDHVSPKLWSDLYNLVKIVKMGQNSEFLPTLSKKWCSSLVKMWGEGQVTQSSPKFGFMIFVYEVGHGQGKHVLNLTFSASIKI